jgi:hypothetical protein
MQRTNSKRAGGRPREQEQFTIAYALWRDGVVNASELQRRLVGPHGFGDQAVDPRTVRRWMEPDGPFEQVSKRMQKEDDPFVWHSASGIGIADAQLPDLLSMLALYDERSHDIQKNMDLPFPAPSVRRVRWWARVRAALPDIGVVDVWAIAAAYERRQLRSDLFAEPLDTADLDALIRHQPWVGDFQLARYEQAIAGGIAAPIREDETYFGLFSLIGHQARAKLDSDGNQTATDETDPVVPMGDPGNIEHHQMAIVMMGSSSLWPDVSGRRRVNGVPLPAWTLPSATRVIIEEESDGKATE